MNFNNFTIKAQEAVQEAVNLVQQMGQQTIEPAHLMAGVLKVGENVTFEFNGKELRLWRMPSSSRAYPMKVDRKAEIYERVLLKTNREARI